MRPSQEWTAAKLGEFTIQVVKDPIAEPDSFGEDGALAGILQKVGDRAKWGDAWFMPGTDLTVGKAVTAITPAPMVAMASTTPSYASST